MKPRPSPRVPRFGGLTRSQLLVAGSPALLAVAGCLTAVERNLDVLLAPAAAANLLGAPYGPLAGLLGVLVEFARG